MFIHCSGTFNLHVERDARGKYGEMRATATNVSLPNESTCAWVRYPLTTLVLAHQPVHFLMTIEHHGLLVHLYGCLHISIAVRPLRGVLESDVGDMVGPRGRIVYSDLVGYQTSDIRLLWTIITRP